MFNKILFYILSFLSILGSCGYISFIFDLQLIYMREPVLGLFGIIYYLLSAALRVWAMYRGAFRLFLSRKVTNLIVMNVLLSMSLGLYDKFHGVLDAVTGKELFNYLSFVLLLNGLSIKVILAASKKQNLFDDVYMYIVRNLEQNIDNAFSFEHIDIQDAIAILAKLPPIFARGHFKRAYLQNIESLRKLPKNPDDLLKKYRW